ncbi:MAG: Hint domain-containing protein [Rhodobacteraceae bacterium]|nr:Hint domain-containing protein [Paracoccaceae bacterium]MCZ8082307.1 Hint domain-containing protein [Paracoccaceae bacterium]
MITGSRGTFVISWTQTEVDGVKGASLDLLSVGAAWRWTGELVRVDGQTDLLLLEDAEGKAEMQKRAARMVRRLIGSAVGKAAEDRPEEKAEEFDDLPDQGFIVTDGVQSFALTIIPVPDSGARLVMMMGDVPPANRDLWVVRTSIDRARVAAGGREGGGVICFTPGTRIATPDGPKLIQSLRPGDRVLTKDDGAQEVLWTGSRRMSGARLYAMPHLRPIRFRAGAFGNDRPEPDLIVSPAHRMLIKGAAAQTLFGTTEVLVRAEDLLNDTTITVDHVLREVTYIHILLERHNIVFANGVETESFHPSNTALEMIDPAQRDVLMAVMPQVAINPEAYGDYARRNLSASEAALLRHDIAA